jgi:hypothetical protein
MQLHDLDGFFRLSARLNYQLNAAVLDHDAILTTILGDCSLPPSDREILKEALDYLFDAYKSKRRRLGPLAVIHPLRATALLVRASEKPNLLDLLTEFFHDKLEDVRREEFEPEVWKELEERFDSLVSKIAPTDEWYLMERLDHLTRRVGDETYYNYIGRLLSNARLTPELVRIKLADRLDNTLDMRISVKDPLSGINFFENIFQLLFVRHYEGYQPDVPHPPTVSFNGSRRMYELFKNIVTLSLIRQTRTARNDPVAKNLIAAICTASMREAERIVTHIFGYHLHDVDQKRRLVLKTQEYCFDGGVDAITPPSHSHRLDGLLLERFDSKDPKKRLASLQTLYEDKELMTQAGIAFIVVFMSFLNNPDYYLQGVSADGIKADSASSLESVSSDSADEDLS